MELHKLTISNQIIVDYFLDLAEQDNNVATTEKLKSEIENLLNIGIIARKSFDVSTKTEYVDEKFKNIETQFNDIIKEHFPKYLQEKLSEMIGQEGDFMTELKSIFGEQGQYDEKINLLIKNWNDKLQIVTNMDNPESPFYKITKNIEDQSEKINQYLITTNEQTKAHMKGQKKGIDFENSLAQVFPEIASDLNCDFERTSNKKGKKKEEGDFLFTNRSTGKKFVIEAKRLGKDPSLKDVRAELAKDIENRGCDYGIYLYYDENPETVPEAGVFSEIERDKLFVCLSSEDPVSTREKIIKIACRYGYTKTEDSENKNALENQKRLADIMNRITQRKIKVDKIKKKTNEISKLTDEIIDDMEADTRQ